MATSSASQSRTALCVALGTGALLLCGLCGLVVAAAGALYFFVGARSAGTGPIIALPVATATPRPPEALEIPIEGFQHVQPGTPLTYDHSPPSSGAHYPNPMVWGVYAEPIPEGNFVHNLEHSGIVILYHCPEGCPELVEQLQDFYDNAPPEDQFKEVKILVTPYDRELPAKVVGLAWGFQLNLYQFDEADKEALLSFYQRHVNQGPEVIP